MIKYRNKSLATAIGILSLPIAYSMSAIDANAVEMEQVVVTAQRRDQSLETTPVAVSVISADQLQKAGISTEADLVTAIPGLMLQGGTSSNQINYVLRGQATDAFSGTRPGVLPYFNDVQISNPGGGSSALYDLQSVQVLKGPQGTLFGRNSTGGAVLFTTTEPENDLGGYITVSGGTYDHRKADGAINLPVIEDTVLLRVAGFYENRDGYQRNLYTDSRVGETDRHGGRLSLKVSPTDDLENITVVDYFRADQGNMASVLWGIDPTAVTPLPLALLFSPALDFIVPQFPDAWNAHLAANPRGNPGGIPGALAAQRARDPWTTDSAFPNYFKAENTLVSNVTRYDFADSDTQITNIIGFGHYRTSNAADPYGTPFMASGVFTDIVNDQFSEEIQLSGSALDDRLEYAVGLFYSDEESDNYILDILIDLPPVIPTGISEFEYKTTSETRAVYGQGTYDLSDMTGMEGLAITLGARYTEEDVGLVIGPRSTFYPAVVANLQIGNPFNEDLDQEKSYENVSWTARLEEQLNPDTLLYLGVRRAFRNGGYNGIIRPVTGDGSVGGNGYNDEKVTDVEIGIKYQGRLGAMPLRMTADVFNTWKENDQRTAFTYDNFGNPGAITVNVPKAEVFGVEFETTVQPADWLEVGLAVNYTDGEFTDNSVSVLGAPQEFKTYPYAPEFSGNFYLQSTFQVAEQMDLIIRAEEYAQASMFITSAGTLNVGSKIPGYGLTNLRVGLQDQEDIWSVTANLKNAFDREYYVGGTVSTQIFQMTGALPGTPRTFTVDLNYKF